MKRDCFSSSAVALVLAVLVVAARGTGTGLLRAPKKNSALLPRSELEALATISNSAEVDPGAAELEPCAVAVVATGKWRTEKKNFAALQQEMGCSIELLDAKQEATLAAQCALGIVQTKEGLAESGLTLFVEAGRGSTQFVVIENMIENGKSGKSGKVIYKAFTDGFPKRKEDQSKADFADAELSRTANQQGVSKEIEEEFGDRINLVVAYGSLWYLMNAAKAPVIADNGEIKMMTDESGVKRWTTGSDFPVLKIFAGAFKNTNMLVIRNVKMADGSIRKVTWGGARDATFIDLGSGKAALVEPKTGTQLQNVELPDDVVGVAEILKKMM